MRTNNKGFSIAEIVIVAAVIAVVGLLGWKGWEAYSNKSTEKTSSSTEASQQNIPTITDNSGLDAADTTLDATDIERTEAAELDSQTNF